MFILEIKVEHLTDKNCVWIWYLQRYVWVGCKSKSPPPQKKRPMGYIAHLRKQFKSINTHGYIITLIKWRKNPSLSLWELNVSWFEHTWIPFTQGCFVPSLVETGQVHGSGEEDFWISWMTFRYFLIISPWKYDEALHLNKLETPSPKYELCQVWLKLAQWFWRTRFLNFVNVFFTIS